MARQNTVTATSFEHAEWLHIKGGVRPRPGEETRADGFMIAGVDL